MRARRLQVGILPKTLLAKSHEKRSMHVSPALVASASLDVAEVYARLKTRPEGLTTDEADTLLAKHGQNILAKDQRPGIFTLVWRSVRNPLVILLAVLATVSLATGDARAVVAEQKSGGRRGAAVHTAGPLPRLTALPALYWPYLVATLLCHVVLTQGVKAWLLRHRWI